MPASYSYWCWQHATTVLFGILSHCVLDISIGAEDCNSNFVQNDENMVVKYFDA